MPESVQVDRRRSLRDLYKTRTPVDFPDSDSFRPGSDEEPEPVRVWVCKLNKADMESVERRAGAAKALILRDRDDPESDVFLAHMAELMVLSDPNLAIPFIAVDKVQERRLSLTAQHSAEGRWGKDDYYESLIDRWKGDGESTETLESIWAAYEEEPPENDEFPDLVPRWREAQQVFAELTEFQNEVNELLDGDLDEIEAQYRIEPDEHGEFDPEETRRLLTKAAKTFIEQMALDVYWNEFARQRAFFSTRQRHTKPDEDGYEVPGPEMRKRYFGTLEDYDECEDEIKDLLRVTYDAFAVAGIAGKGSPAATTSSSPPESTDPTQPDSGPETANT